MKQFNYFLTLFLLICGFQVAMAVPNGRRVNVSTLTPAQRSTLASAMLGYIDQAIIEEHSCNTEFGNANGVAGSIHGPEMFLNWHRQYLAEMEEAIQPTLASMGLTLLPRWNPANGIALISAFNTVDPDCSSSCGTLTCAAPSGFPNGYSTSFPSIFNPPIGCFNWSTFENFSEFLRTGYHGIGHLAPGGVMGNFKSPACPIFWLWHAMIDDIYWDFQDNCMANADLHIKDTPADTGIEPNPDSGPMWISSDIWVRQNQDSPTGGTTIPHGSASYTNEGSHENPEYKMSGDNYIYVRIRNSSSQTFAGGRLRVYWSKASTGLAWPTTWINYFSGGVLSGDEILPTGTGLVPDDANFYIPPIDPGNQFIMEIPWRVPNPADFTTDIHHFCILARIVSDFDDMTFPEGSGIGSNVRNNNNIAWKNVSVYDVDPMNIMDPGSGTDYIAKAVSFTGVYLTNATNRDMITRLTLHTLRDPRLGDFYDNGGMAFIRLENELALRWERTGFAGEGIRPIGWHDDKLYAILESPEATIEEIALSPRDNLAFEMGFAMVNSPRRYGQFEYDIVQSTGGVNIGGERFQLNVTTNDNDRDQIRSAGEDALANTATVFNVSPNPASDLFTLSYELDKAQAVNVALFDITGRKVRQLITKQQVAGTHSTTVNAKELSAGVYLLRIQVGNQLTTQKVVIE